MKISVLIPYYNDAAFLRTAIDSVLSQAYPDFELVLVNHASEDESRAIAHGYDDARIVHVDMPENNGAGGGLVIEAFLAAANGEAVKFFCADDIMRPGCLATLASVLEAHPEIDIAFGDLEYIDFVGRSVGKTWFGVRQDFERDMDEVVCLRKYARGKSVLPWIGSLVRRSALEKIRLDATLVMMFDMSVWTQLLLLGSRLMLTDKVVAGYRLHDGQVSAAANVELARHQSVFEWQAYAKLFLETKNRTLLRAVFVDEPGVATAADNFELNAAIALRYLRDPETACVSHWAYALLHEALNDAFGRERLRDRLGLTVAVLRSLVRAGAPKPRRKSQWVRFRDRLRKLVGFRSGADELSA